MSTENRVSGSDLSDTPPSDGILEMENGKCLPTQADNVKQRENYIVLAERAILSNILSPSRVSDVVTSHIPHRYKKEMAEKSETVS